MVLKFPSGKVSISYRDLQSNHHSQSSACGVCNKPWLIRSDGCIENQLHVLHPCQHLVGSGCWTSVPDEHKYKCPVCKVEILRDEKVGVHSAVKTSTPASQDTVPKTSGWEEEMEGGKAQDMLAWKKIEEGLNDIDVRAIMYYMNLRALLDSVKGSLSTLLASTKCLTPTHRERLVLFLTHAPQTNEDSRQRKVEIALSAFNISGGTNFTINDLRTTLSSAEGWIKKHFAAILENNEKADNEDSAIRDLEKEIADMEVELEELKCRPYRESAQRLKEEIRMAAAEIVRKAEKEPVKIEFYEDRVKTLIKAKKEKATLQSHGKAILKRYNVAEEVVQIKPKDPQNVARNEGVIVSMHHDSGPGSPPEKWFNRQQLLMAQLVLLHLLLVAISLALRFY